MAQRFPSLRTMRAKWDEPTSKTIKVPSIGTILLAVLLLGAVTAIVWVSLAVQGEAPTSPAPPASEPVEGPAAWLSARSTFWGAIAGGIGAIGTAGALGLGAYTYFRQVRDQHRAQAAAVSLVTADGERTGFLRMMVRNDSNLPISDVYLQALNHNGNDAGHEMQQVLAPGGVLPLDRPKRSVDRAWVKFDDSSGIRWARYVNGELEEVKKSKDGKSNRTL